MNLTPVERERITDSLLKIQSARASLENVDDTKYPNAEEIESCLESADQHLKEALGYARPETARKPASDCESADK
jgi:hypothetical protein